MKNMHLLSFLLMPILMVAQPKIKRETVEYRDQQGKWNPVNVLDYTFNEMGLPTTKTYTGFSEGKQYIVEQELTEYNSIGQAVKISTYRKPQDTTSIYLSSTWEYITGADGCPTAGTYQYFDVDGSLLGTTKNEYYRGSDCRLDSIVIISCYDNFGVNNCFPEIYEANKYDSDGHLVAQHLGEWDFETQSFVRVENARVWKYENGKLIERIVQDEGGLFGRTEYDYDSKGNQLSEAGYSADSSGNWVLDYLFSNEYDYDENDFVVRKKASYDYFYFNYSVAYDFTYFNFCDGLPHVVFQNTDGRTTYEYTEGVECQGGFLNKAPAVNPNPASDFLTVKWPNLEQGKTVIELYSALGSQITDLPIDYRTHEVKLDVSNLTTGIYFLKITSGKNKYGKKILIR